MLPYVIYSTWTVPKSLLDSLGITPVLQEAGVPPSQVKFQSLYNYVYNLAGGDPKKFADLGVNFVSVGGQTAIPIPGSITTYVVSLAPGNVALQLANAFAVGLIFLKDLPALLIVTSRMVFSWAFDRFFPEMFAAVNDRFHSPHWAILLVALSALVGSTMVATMGRWVGTVSTTLLFQFGVSMTCLMAIVFPWIRRELYEMGPKIEVFGIPLITILGLIGFPVNFFFFLWVVTTMLLPHVIFQVICMTIGAMIFAGMLVYNMKRGVDVKSIYAEVPPA